MSPGKKIKCYGLDYFIFNCAKVLRNRKFGRNALCLRQCGSLKPIKILHSFNDIEVSAQSVQITSLNYQCIYL